MLRRHLIVVFALIALVITSGCGGGAAALTTASPGASPSWAAPLSFSMLRINTVTASGSTVTIKGATDVPDGAQVSVTLDIWGRPASALYIGVDKFVTVSNGLFEASLKIPQRPEFRRGPYSVEVMFTPKGQSAFVDQMVGSSGEHLSGSKVQKGFGFKTLDVIKKVSDLHATVAVKTYAFQTPAAFPYPSPQNAVAQFADAWRAKAWARMLRCTQLTWRSSTHSPASYLSDMFGFKRLIGFRELRTSMTSAVMANVTCEITYEAIANQLETKLVTATVIRESGPEQPSTSGTWGVNPISVTGESSP